MRRAGLALMALLLGGCVGPGPRADTGPGADRLLTLRAYLSGSFSSAAQAARDPAYYEMTLHAKPMWTWRDDGPWLYAELGVEGREPSRQRVYKLERTADGRFWARAFLIPAPEEHAGAWRSGSPLSEMSPADLEERVGCALTLAWDDDAQVFTGGTTGTGCPSDLAGAAYTTTLATFGPDLLRIWERGYDATGEQVWGAARRGYEFRRVERGVSRATPARENPAGSGGHAR